MKLGKMAVLVVVLISQLVDVKAQLRLKVLTLVTVLWVCFIPAVGQQSLDSPLGHVGGGTLPERNEFPFMVRLDWPTSYCSATLIADHWILTAAHCVVPHDGSISKPTTATHGVSYESEVNSSIGRVIPHPDYYYKGAGFWYDAALVEILEPFQLEDADSVGLLTISGEESHARPETDAIVLGYGIGSGTNHDTLLMAELSLWPGLSCRQRFNNTLAGGIVHEHTVCAYESGKSTGSGDSGGPLLVDTPGGWAQVGVHSMGTLGVSVSTRVSSIYDWVQATTLAVSPVSAETVLVGTFFNGNSAFMSSRAYIWNPSDADATVMARAYTLPRSGPSTLLGTVDLGFINARSGRNIKIAEDILVSLGIVLPYVVDGGNLMVEFTVGAYGVSGTG